MKVTSRSVVVILLFQSLILMGGGIAWGEPPAVAEAEASKAEASEAGAKQADVEEESEEEPPVMKVATITIKGAVAEGPSGGSPFAPDNADLAGLVRRFDDVAKDDEISSLVLRLRGGAMGRGSLNEVRQAIKRVRKSGKQVIAEFESAGPGDYLIAAACDKIVMPESGTVLIPGVRGELMFYKNLFDRFDVEVDMLQVGDFKGAAEPYTRSSMSDAFKKQLSHVLDDFFDQMVDTIANDRGLPRDKVRALIDQGMLTADDAQAGGLIDTVQYPQELMAALQGDTDDECFELEEDYGKKDVDTDFSGMGGFIKMMELFSGGGRSKRRSKKQKIAVVYAVGAITSGESGAGLMGQSMGSDTIVEAIRDAAEDATVKAIVLRVNSPGGSALASDLIWNEIEDAGKPVIASMGDVAASGGYYISMGCDKIVAEPGTLTGSIGVVGGKLAIGKALDHFGVTTDTISRGKNSGMFSANQPFTDSERAAWKRMMEKTYGQFTSKAAEGRGMNVAELKKLAGGRVWTGRQAVENGLVDELGTLQDAIVLAKEAAGFDAEEKMGLLVLPEAKSFFEQMFSGMGVQPPPIKGVTDGPLGRLWHEAQVMQQLFQEPSVLVMPARVEIR